MAHEGGFGRSDRADPRRRGDRARRLGGLILCAALAGCLNTVDDPNLFTSASVTPRLQNGEAERRGPVVNAAAFNADQKAAAIAPFAGFFGTLRVDYAGDRATTQSDVAEIRSATSSSFNPAETVTVDFTNASIDFILKQLLGGALGVNYIASDDLGGKVTFRTETPIPKSRILQVVRDILARNNLVIRFIDGIYHVGGADVIQAIQANGALGRSGEETTRIVKLKRSNAAKVVDLASQLLPPNVSVTVSSAANTIVIRSDPNDADSVEALLRSLSDTAISNEQVAIIPLSQGAPETVAQGLSEFYQSTLRGNEPPVTIIALQSQQAILVGTSDPSLMEGVQQLARQLDRSVTDVSSLRIIPLTNLHAADIVPQLSQIFGSTAEAGASSSASTEGLGGVEGASLGGVPKNSPTSLRPRPVPQTAIDDNDDGTGLAVSGPVVGLTPQISPDAGEAGDAGDGRSGRRGDRGGGADGGDQAPQRPAVTQTAAPKAGETRIVADTRTNTILVYSTYSTYKRMREVVQTLDVAQAQVVIEATVVEVDLNDTLSSGVQFFLEGNGVVAGSGIPDGNTSARRGGVIGIGTTIGNVNVSAVLSALSAVTKLKVISSPYLTVLDGKSARLVIGDQIPFASRSQTSNNQGSVTVTQDVEILDTGVVLEITPQIHANNSVDLQVNQSVSTPSQTANTGDLTPVIATRNIQSQVLVQSGRTILLGGLIQDRLEKTDEGVPKISRVPVLGNLFKQKSSGARRTELLVMITPRVVRSSSEIENLTRIIQSSQVGAAPLGEARGTPVYKP